MTTRDRIVLIVIATLALLAAGWFLVVSPERKEAASLAQQVSTAQAALTSAQGEASSANQARERYASAYASIVSLGKAVPASEEVPSLIYQLAQASNQKHVEFSSISTGANSSGASAPSSSAAATAGAGAPTGFTQMPFTFVFNGGFDELSRLFSSLNAATVRTSSGDLRVKGRLLTLQAVKLAHAASGDLASKQLTGTITATAYVLPPGQGVTGSPTSPTPAPGAAATVAAGAKATPSAPVATIGVPR